MEGQRVQLGVRRVIDTSCGQYVGCDHERGTEDRRGHRRQSGGQAGRRPCRLPDRSLPSVRPGRRDNTNRDRRRLYERGLSTFEAAAVGVGNEAAGRASGRRTPRRVGRRGRRLAVPCRPQRADGGTWPAPRPPSAVPSPGSPSSVGFVLAVLRQRITAKGCRRRAGWSYSRAEIR